MRIVDRETFLSLPENTVYCTYAPRVFGPIEIKGESLANDWYLQSLDTVAGDCTDSVLEAAEVGAPFRFDLDCQGRDGCYDNATKYAVWDNEDVESLISRLKECIK